MHNKMNKDTTQVSEKYRAPALDKGLDILELLAQHAGGLTRSEIVSAMDRRPGEIYRMLERLVARRYVSRSQEGDRYSLTLKLFLLGTVHPPVRRLVTLVQPLMDTFARDTGQSIHLAALDQGKAIVIAQASSAGNWEFKLKIGAALDLTNTGSGKTLLAYQQEQYKDDLIKTLSKNVKKKALRDELIEIKTDGYRISSSAQLKGVTDISVPLLGHDEQSFGVFTCPYIERLEPPPTGKSAATVSIILKLLIALSKSTSP